MSARQASPLGVVRAATRPWPGLFWLNVLLWTLFHVLPVFYGIAVGWVFDALAAGDPNAVQEGIFLFGAVVLARVGTFELGVWRYSLFWHRWRVLLQRNLLAWLLTADGSRVPPSATGAAVSTFREDVDELVEYVENWIDGGGLVAFVLVALGVLVSIDPLLTGVVIVPMVLAAVLNRMMSDTIRDRRTHLRLATESVTGYLGDVFRAIMPVKAAGVEHRLLSHLEDLNETRNDAALRDTAITEILRSVVQNMANIATGLVLIVGAGSHREGALSVGALATFVVYIPRLTNYLAWAGEIGAQRARTDVAGGRLRRLSVDAADEGLL